jgi:large subunit ribosomal protein L20
MPRVRKGSARTQARQKLLRKARGYYGDSSKVKWKAKVAVMTAGIYGYRDRRLRKRDMRALWIIRITAACRMRNSRYSVFINGLKLAGIILNRKMLSELAIKDPKAFDAIFATAIAAQKKGQPKITTGLEFGPVAGKAVAAAKGATAVAQTNNIEDIEGVGPAMAKKLAAIGIKSISDFRSATATKAAREDVSKKSGIKPENINKWAFASDLFQVPGVDGDYAELLVAIGVHNVAELATKSGGALSKAMVAGNKDASGKAISQRVPSGSDCEGWIAAAKGLKAVVMP